MVNLNGDIISSTTTLHNNNRAFLYGDGVFETLKIVNSKILFLEEHYFRLVSSMRIVRMEIPMNFTMEYFEEQILNLSTINNCLQSCKARITVFRNEGGLYLPNTNTISFLIQTNPIENANYQLNLSNYEVELYKDFVVPKQLLSTIKTTNKIINVTGSIFAKENDFQNCFLLNTDKNVIEALNGNIFMLLENKLITPALSEGCLNGIMRKQVLKMAKKIENIEVVEGVISPFDLQKADELFITNVIIGIQPITKYRKKEYKSIIAFQLNELLNDLVQ